MAFDSLDEALAAFDRLAETVDIQVRDCSPYQLTEEDYSRAKKSMASGGQGNLKQAAKRRSSEELVAGFGFDGDLMVIARDYCYAARAMSEDYCVKMEAVPQESRDAAFRGPGGKLSRLRYTLSKDDRARKDAEMKVAGDARAAQLRSEFETALEELYSDMRAILIDAYGKNNC